MSKTVTTTNGLLKLYCENHQALQDPVIISHLPTNFYTTNGRLATPCKSSQTMQMQKPKQITQQDVVWWDKIEDSGYFELLR
jgi:hypothetical protein